MPLSEKFPIGSRVTGTVVLLGELNRPYVIPMKVLGYDGLKSVIVETLEDAGSWRKGKVVLMPTKDLTLREEVKHITGEAGGPDGPAIGWMELGGLSVGLSRSERDGTLLVSLEKAPGHDAAVRVRIIPAHETNGDLWEGMVD